MPLRRYKVGNTILKLNDEDARRRGLLGQTSQTQETQETTAEEPQIVSSSRAATTRTSKRA